MGRRRSRSLHQLSMIRGHRTSFTGRHVLEVVEAEGTDVTDSPDLAALVAAAYGLAAIFDDSKIISGRDFHDCVHVANGTPHVYGDNGFGVRSDGVLYGSRIDGDALIDIDDDRYGSGCQDREGGSHVGVSGYQNFVSGTQTE